MFAAEKSMVDLTRKAILARVDFFQRATRVPDSTISRMAVSDSDFLMRLRNGENVTTDKLRRLELWLETADPTKKYDVRIRRKPRAPNDTKA